MTARDQDESSKRRIRWLVVGLVFGLIVLLFGVSAIHLAQPRKVPAENSADVGFARDMSVHHAQAVEMANIVYRRTDDPDIARIALDIGTTQQFQIGMLTGWLDIWGRTISSGNRVMSWMSGYDMSLPNPPLGLDDPMSAMDMSSAQKLPPEKNANDAVPSMPGMATQIQIDELDRLPPDQMDIRFLQLMIRHHQGGVLMAQAALDLAHDTHVRTFAHQVIDSQAAEIETMTHMLDERLGNATVGAPVDTPLANSDVDRE